MQRLAPMPRSIVIKKHCPTSLPQTTKPSSLFEKPLWLVGQRGSPILRKVIFTVIFKWPIGISLQASLGPMLLLNTTLPKNSVHKNFYVETLHFQERPFRLKGVLD